MAFPALLRRHGSVENADGSVEKGQKRQQRSSDLQTARRHLKAAGWDLAQAERMHEEDEIEKRKPGPNREKKAKAKKKEEDEPLHIRPPKKPKLAQAAAPPPPKHALPSTAGPSKAPVDPKATPAASVAPKASAEGKSSLKPKRKEGDLEERR